MQDRFDREHNGFVRESPLGRFGTGAMRVALLFGTAAIAFALIAVPLLEKNRGGGVASVSRFLDLDFTSTGSVARGSTYTERRSVLQRTPGAVCIIRGDGTLSGDCP